MKPQARFLVKNFSPDLIGTFSAVAAVNSGKCCPQSQLLLFDIQPQV